MREWLARLVDWFRRDRLETELREELDFHRRQIEGEAAGDGAGADEARRIAARRLGNVTKATEEARDRWSIPSLEAVQQDTRYALRGLVRTPAFTATVAITLALGTGANVAIFDAIDRLMFRPLALLRDPGTVHRVYFEHVDRGRVNTSWWLPFGRYHDLRNWTNAFSHFAAFNEREIVIGTGDSARERRVGGVTATYFDFFEARPVLGRFFSPAEDTAPAGAPLVVLSHALWQTEFAGRNVVGDALQVGNLAATIIGVAPPGFIGVNDAQPVALFVPLTSLGGVMGGQAATRFSTGYSLFWGSLIVRRKPGISEETASAELSTAFERSWEAERAAQPNQMLRPAGEARPRALVGAVRIGGGPSAGMEARTALWVAGVAVIVLIIACANVANLFIGRAIARQRETAVRLALGVSRARLLIQTMVESLAVATMGAVGGLAVAWVARTAVFGLLVPTARTGNTGLFDPRTLAATAVIAFVPGILIGLVPAWSAARTGLAASLKSGGRAGNTHGTRLRNALVIVQATLSVVLLAGAVLFVKSLNAVEAMPLGYEANRVLLVNRVLRGVTLTRDERMALRHRLLETAQSLPVVESAAWRLSTPLGVNAVGSFHVDGVESLRDLGTFTMQITTEDYFRAMGTRIVRGRGFTADDRAGAPGVVVVSQGLASVVWPGQDAVGQCMRMGRREAPCTTVIGIAEDIYQNTLTDERRYHYYVPLDQAGGLDATGLVLRLRSNPAQAADEVRRALQAVMPGDSYVSVQPMSVLVERAQSSWRLGATMFVAFGALALLVAAIGLYGVISYSIAQRMHEIAVRVALGASRRDVRRLVFVPALRFALIGCVLGTAIALLMRGRLEPLLFRQSASDPLVYAGVAGLMLVVAALASLQPAARAAGADPLEALRTE